MEIARTEPGLLQYDWFLSPDDSTCVVRETYTDSDAVLAHIGAVGHLLEEMIGLGGGLEVDVFGDPSEALQEAAAEMQPAVYSYFQGK